MAGAPAKGPLKSKPSANTIRKASAQMPIWTRPIWRLSTSSATSIVVACAMFPSPSSRFRACSMAATVTLLHLVPHQIGDEVTLHLRAAGGDGRDARIAIMPLHVEFLVLALAAQHPHAPHT